MFQINDVVETWYYRNADDAKTNDVRKSVGYKKAINGVTVVATGVTTAYQASKTALDGGS